MKDTYFFSGLAKIIEKEKAEAISYYNITKNNTFGRFIKTLSLLEEKIKRRIFEFNEDEQYLIYELLEIALEKGSISAMKHYELTFDELFKVDETYIQSCQQQSILH